MIKYKLFFTFFLGVSINLLFAQTITLRGMVSDSLNNSLSYANIVAKPIMDEDNVKFTSSDANGNYIIELLKEIPYEISVYYLGFETFKQHFKSSKSEVLNFYLKTNPTALKEVEVTFELPIVIKDDTTTYSVDAFNKGSERKLKDVLENLPGIEVEKNGTVFFKGRKVTDLLVEDKEFFNGGTKLGVENIPADAVDKVQVLENYNNISFLKGLSDEDNIALNIKLKEGKKKFVFGDLEGGKGSEDYFKGGSNVFYYSPKEAINSISSLNNIGDKVFTFTDYLNFQGGVNAIFSGDFNFQSENLNQFLETDQSLSRNQKFTAFNFTKTTSSKLSFSSYFILNNLSKENLVQSFNQYTTFTENKESKSDAKNFIGIGNIDIKYNSSNDLNISSKTQIKRSKLNHSNNIFSNTNETLNTFRKEAKVKPVFINQNIEIHKKFSSDHNVSLLGNFSYTKNNQNKSWESNTNSFSTLLPIVNQSTIRLNQINNLEKQNYNFLIKHFWLLNRTNHIYSTIGYKVRKSLFFTEENQVLDNETKSLLAENEFGNNLKYKLNDLWIGVHYKFKKGIFTAKQGFQAHKYSWDVNQSSILKKSKWVLLPEMLIGIELNRSKKVEFRYALKTSFSEGKNFSNRFYLQSYNSIFKGNENLENELYHSSNIQYRSNSLYRGLSLFANINLTKRVYGYVSEVKFNETNQFLTTVLLDNASESISFTGFVRKRINKIEFKLDGRVRKSNYLQKIDNLIIRNESNSFSPGFGIETLFKKYPNIETGFNKTMNKYKSQQETRFEVDDIYVNIDYDFTEKLNFSANYSLSVYRNKSIEQKNNYETMRFMLSYRYKKTPWTFNIIGNNILNVKVKQTNTFQDYLISDVKEFLLPQIFMMSIEYKI